MLGVEPVWVEGDPVRLAQIVSNLIDNAAKYAPESGQILVTIRPEGRDVNVEVPTLDTVITRVATLPSDPRVPPAAPARTPPAAPRQSSP
jgi:hypothetical protein